MIYTTKTTTNYYVSTLKEVLDLRAWLQRTCTGSLTSFTYTEKPLKEGKEIVGEFYIVKATITIDSEKEPDGTMPVYLTDEKPESKEPVNYIFE